MFGFETFAEIGKATFVSGAEAFEGICEEKLMGMSENKKYTVEEIQKLLDSAMQKFKEDVDEE